MSRPTVIALLRAGLFLVWVGLLSISASGVVAAGMNAALGSSFVAGDLPWETYTPDRCVELQRLAPAAATCADAAALHHTDEVVEYRVGAGVLGLVALLAWSVWRRRSPSAGSLPPGLVSGAATATFGVVGVALLGIGVERLVVGMSAGPGAMLSAGLVALVVAAFFGWRLYRELAAPSL